MGGSIQLHAPVVLLPSEIALTTHGTKGLVGSGDGMDILEKRKIPCPYRESKKGSLVVHVLVQ